jgi:radical SAM superfamily enzyme YgiQ (UPF0313 family)
MKVALIWPYGNDCTYSIPLGLAYLVANCKIPGIEFKVFDGTLYNSDASSDNFKNLLLTYRPDVVGISCWSKTFVETCKMLAVTKTLLPGCITVLGGIHPTAYTTKTLENSLADYVIAGEAEFSFKEFLSNVGNPGGLHSVPGLAYRTEKGIVANPPFLQQDLDAIALPDYDAIELVKYFKKGYRYFSSITRNAPIWMTRGCPYSCKFCTAPKINGKKIRKHSVEYGMEWIAMLYTRYGVRHINIVDDNFTFYSDYTKSFCEALIRKNLKGLTMYTANGIRAQRTDFETLKLMKRAGWRIATVAPESGSKNVLHLMKKDLDPDIWPAKVKEIRDAGLISHGLFLMGYPGETLQDIKETQELIKRCKFDSIAIQYFQPLPGTPIYDELVENGEIEDTLLPNTTSGSRVYVTKHLVGFNFSRFAFRMYMYTFAKHPIRVLQQMFSYHPALMIKRLAVLVYDTFIGLNKK